MAEPKPKGQETPNDAPKRVPDGNRDAFNAILRQAVPDERDDEDSLEPRPGPR